MSMAIRQAQANPPTRERRRCFRGTALPLRLSELPIIMRLDTQLRGSVIGALSAVVAYLRGSHDGLQQAELKSLFGDHSGTSIGALYQGIARVAESFQLDVAVYADGEPEELAVILRRGIPVMCLIDAMPPQGMLHCVLLEQVEWLIDGCVPSHVHYIDPALGERLEEPWRYFERQWDALLSDGTRRCFMAFTPSGVALEAAL